MKCWFGHVWPEYFQSGGDDLGGIPDGLGVHHLRIYRLCLRCGEHQTAMIHVPSVYVRAFNVMEKVNYTLRTMK